MTELSTFTVSGGATSGLVTVTALLPELRVLGFAPLKVADPTGENVNPSDKAPPAMAVSDRVQDSPESKLDTVPVAGGVKETSFVPETLQTARTVIDGCAVTRLGLLFE